MPPAMRRMQKVAGKNQTTLGNFSVEPSCTSVASAPSPSLGAEPWPEAGPLQGRGQQGPEEVLGRKPGWYWTNLWLSGPWGVGMSKSKGRQISSHPS